MIPKSSTLAVTDSLPGKEVEFTIGDPFWIMESLSDLYSNKELACVRELSTNARDAQVEAGNGDKPIEVSLPTIMSPYFKVKDCGVGMSVEELEEVYTSFGVSTKRQSNAYNGMLGFGSKAPIAYTGTFTVTSIKDGVKAVAVISKKPESIVLKVVMTSKTSEPNGVEVSVPVHNYQAFSQIARDFYRFWIPGTVLVDGKAPVQAVGEKIDDGLYYSTTPGTSYVVMGNVAYRIANPTALFTSSALARISFVAYVPNGSVEFTPSREDLKYTEHTKKSLHAVIAGFEKKMLDESKAQIENAANHIEAWKLWKDWTDKLGQALFRGVTYKGDMFPLNFDIKGTRYEIRQPGDYYNRYNTYKIDTYGVGSMSNTLIITNFTPDLNASHKGKVRTWAEHVGRKVKFAIFVPGDFENKWVSKDKIISWEQLKSEVPKKARASYNGVTGPKRPKGLFDYVTKAGRQDEKELPTTGTIYYATAAEYNTLDMAHALRLLNDDGIIVVLAKNRIDKFTRDNPTAINFVEHARKKVNLDGNSLLTDKGKKALAVGANTRQWLAYLDVSRIVDPAFAETKTLIDDRADWLKDYNDAMSLAHALGMSRDFKRHTIYRNDESLMKGYPLLDNLSWYSINADLYIYLNAKYASKKGN